MGTDGNVPRTHHQTPGSRGRSCSHEATAVPAQMIVLHPRHEVDGVPLGSPYATALRVNCFEYELAELNRVSFPAPPPYPALLRREGRWEPANQAM